MFHSHTEAYIGYNCSTKLCTSKDDRVVEWSLRAWILELACVGSSAFSLNIILSWIVKLV